MDIDVDISTLDDTLEDPDDTNVQLTSAELLQMMEEIWVNEKFAPEILPNKQEVVDCVLGQISYMEKNLETLPCTDFKKGLHQLEVDRIRFLVTSYLRQRLEKIEAYVFQILKEEEQRTQREEESYLTEAEEQFAVKFKEALEQHFESVTSLVLGLPFDDWRKEPIKPNLNSFVFSKAKENVDGVAVNGGQDDNEVVDVRAGSQVFISYSSIADLLKKGDVRLI